MASKVARRTKNLIKRTRGMINRAPRCVNLSRTPNVDIIGYVEVNANATTPFSRSKVHKGIFCCLRTEIDTGELILDRGDNDYYFVMDQKVEIFNGEDVYVDATLYRCDRVIEVQRFGAGARDTFGRPVQDAPTVVASDIRAMFNPLNFDSKVQEDRQVTSNKIKMCVQSSVGIQPADRIVTNAGETFLVTSIDTTSLTNLVLCTVDSDVR